MFIQKNTKTANIKKAVSFFIGLFLLSANCLNPLNNKVSAMENEDFFKNKKTSSSAGKNKPPVAPLQNNKNQFPLNEETNDGGNGEEENLQISNDVANTNPDFNETNNEENQNLANQSQADSQNTNFLLLPTSNLYFNDKTSQTVSKSNLSKEENTVQTNEDNNGIIATNGENLEFKDVFDFFINEKDKTISIAGVKEFYKNLIKEISLPKFFNINNQQMKIISIGCYAFSDCSKLIKIIVSDSIIQIGCFAFECCENLKTIALSNSIIKIGSKAFHKCISLEIIVLPNSIAYLQKDSFSFCENLTTAILPNSITFIDEYAFYNCHKLKNINFPKSISHIGKFAFSGCINLTTIVLPNSIININSCAFRNCIRSIIIFPKYLNFIGFDAFANCKSLENPEIPNSAIINQGSFCNCDSLLKLIKKQLKRDYENIFEFYHKGLS
ncbi:MAG: leucine-rich repeat domain-containing protein [Oscillospiraceae bacterium]|nr:leucine-rich repeat domain-containing protein [Oscillospiraceae bacterium]